MKKNPPLIYSPEIGIDTAFFLGYKALKPWAIEVSHLKSIIKLVFFLLFLIIFYDRYFNLSFMKRMNTILLKSAFFFHVIIAVVDLITKYIFKKPIFVQILFWIFGLRSTSQATNYLGRFGLLGIQGVYAEPSHYAFYAFLVATYIFFSTKESYIKKILLINYSVLTFFSTSTTGFIVSVIVFLYFLVSYLNNLKSKYGFIFIIWIIILFVLFFMTLYTYNFFNSNYIKSNINKIIGFLKGRSTVSFSELARRNSIIENLRIFSSYPMFGIGFGSTTSTSFLATLLSNFGIIGVILYIGIFFPNGIKIDKKRLVLAFFLLIMLWGGGNLSTIVSPSLVIIIAIYGKKTRLSQIAPEN
ncbi:hypothetical protein XO12_05850 [Marinitoga sp. 1154]|nr:hypothetical protein [Marinitoga sp. 1154]